jgi:hypothetical protein
MLFGHRHLRNSIAVIGFLLAYPCFAQIPQPSPQQPSSSGSGATIPSTTNLLSGNGSGGVSNSGIAPNATGLSNAQYAAGGGTANAQTVTLAPAITSLTTGLLVCWTPAANNTSGTPTLSVNGLAAKTITRANNAALQPGDILTIAVACARYDGTNFELQDPQVPTFPTVIKHIANTGNTTNQTITLVASPVTGTYRLNDIVEFVNDPGDGTTLTCLGVSFVDPATNALTYIGAPASNATCLAGGNVSLGAWFGTSPQFPITSLYSYKFYVDLGGNSGAYTGFFATGAVPLIFTAASGSAITYYIGYTGAPGASYNVDITLERLN